MRKLIIILISNSLFLAAFSQGHEPENNRQLGIKEYIADVTHGNLGYIASRFNVDIAEAS